MQKVKCVFCRIEEWAEKMYYCASCQFWICGHCVEKSGFLGTGSFKCPKCHKDLPDNK